MKNTKHLYFDEETGKQLRPLPTRWMTPRKALKVGGKVRLTNHIALRLGTRGPEFADWDGVVEIVRVRHGSGSFPSRWNEEYECYDTESEGYLTVRLPYPYGVSTPPSPDDNLTICHLSDEGVEWEAVS
jgi:hypothetical protein